jgi:uncharacterized protein
MPGNLGEHEDLNESLPIDVMPCSNGEFMPAPPTQAQIDIMRLASEQTENTRRRLGMSRRQFVRTAAAYGIGLAAINQVRDLTWGHYSARGDGTATTAACDLEYPNAQLANLPGEFIFDVQSHHVESDGTWRVTNPVMQGFFAGVWSQAGPLGGIPGRRADGSVRGFGAGEVDPIENLSRFHYLKELYLDSSTTMCVLSAVPSDPENQPLPLEKAALTVRTVNELSGSRRCVMHAFVMPNRGSLGTGSSALGRPPVFQQAEFDAMEENAVKYHDMLVGWKTYPAWGDVPYASGWYFDDDLGLAFCEQVLRVSQKYGVPPVIATHKGFALPAFDQRAASPRDIGPAARQYPGVRFIVYHSGYDSQNEEFAYPGDDKVNSADRSVNAFVKSLRENRWDATRFIPPGLSHGNVPNVWAEIGSTWRTLMGDPNSAAHLLGKLITYVGAKRIAWGTDSLWFGSPQSEIVGLRSFEMSQQAKEFYNLPFGLEGDVDDPTKNAQDASSYMSAHPAVPGWPTDGRAHPERTIRNGIFGRNAAIAYEVDPDAAFKTMSCDDVQKVRDAYYVNQYTPKEAAPMASNQVLGPRTGQELINHRASAPWSP